MDLVVVGRHALFFDDDSLAAFVNSGDALVDWNSLQIDRYDVRHLLSAPPPSRRRSNSSSSSNLVDASIQLELDKERYLDLPLPSDEPDLEEGDESADAGAYRAVGFSYGNTDDLADRRSSEVQESSVFRPSFQVPESLLQCLMLGAGMEFL
uniref:Suppressor of white apricot N-terminal domain-containing protein n=1 Tax=Solanum lycopersicum TaxID=4081 RepID=A0A3Q7IB45_SOLLC